MSYPFIQGKTLDDVTHDVFEEIMKHGRTVTATKGPNRELSGVLLEILDPRARLSRTETRGRVFSCLGELCWYLAGSRDGKFISYYLSHYAKSVEDQVVWGGYGPRLFGQGQFAQFETIISLLRKKPSSRQAVIQLFSPEDLTGEHLDVPCTLTLQFFIRDNKLDLVACMRSNDAYRGLPHDVFAFTMLQEILARTLDIELGTYRHFVGSLHLYDEDAQASEAFLGEGFQSTTKPMPQMPAGDPWESVRALLEAESSIREAGDLGDGFFLSLHPYWQDLIRLLLIFKNTKGGNPAAAQSVGQSMSATVYDVFIEKRLQKYEVEESGNPVR